jgi:hypothetical protein
MGVSSVIQSAQAQAQADASPVLPLLDAARYLLHRASESSSTCQPGIESPPAVGAKNLSRSKRGDSDQRSSGGFGLSPQSHVAKYQSQPSKHSLLSHGASEVSETSQLPNILMKRMVSMRSSKARENDHLEGFHRTLSSNSLVRTDNTLLVDPPHLKQSLQEDLRSQLDYHSYTVQLDAFSSQTPKCGGRWIIYPDSVFRLCWDFIGMLLVVAAFLVVPFELSFDMELAEESNFMHTLSLACDAFFCVDIVLNFRTGFYRRGLIITNVYKIYRNY